MIRTNPIAVTWRDVANVAIYLNKTYKQVEDIASHTKLLLSALDKRFLETKATKVFIDALGVHVYSYNGDVYFPSNYNNIADATKRTLLVISYCVLEYGEATSIINKHVEHFRNVEYYYAEIANSIIRIKSSHNDISAKYGKIAPFVAPDYKELLKAAKRMKIKLLINSDGFRLEMGKCECGNEIEGTIKYKNIILRFSNSWHILGAQFHFSDWIMDTRWGLHAHVHPHISSSDNICYGNRLDDFEAYRAGNHYAFLLDLIKETCNSYSPERPYASIKQIGKELVSIKAALPKFIKTNPDYSDEEAKSEMLLKFMAQHRRVCPVCSSYMIGFECTNDNCVRNPLADIHCATCNSVLTWSEANHTLLCPNIANHNTPVPIVGASATIIADDLTTGIAADEAELDDMLNALESIPIQAPPDPTPVNEGSNFDTDGGIICRECTYNLHEALTANLININDDAPENLVGTNQPAGWYCDNRACSIRYATQVTPGRAVLYLITNISQ